MNVVLWDTRRNDAQKDFAGGMGVGMFTGGPGLRGKLISRWYRRDFRPVAMNFAYLAAIARRLGHDVRYVEDQLPRADLFIFNPSLLTLDVEIRAIEDIKVDQPNAEVWVVGSVAYAKSGRLKKLGVKVIRGEPEQLLWKWEEVLNAEQGVFNVGSVENLDQLPYPDWSVFPWKKFRVKYDFWQFPTAFVQQSRGCTFKCNYCPYIMVESKTRFRNPGAVVDEIRYCAERYGFKSFKFRDPLFGLDRKRALQVAEGIRRMSTRIQFSVETRIDLMRPETLKALRDAGLTSITVGIETPNENTLRQHQRTPINDDRQQEFVARCREMGIRTVAGFMVGFIDDTEHSIQKVLDYARKINPTYANFNVVTPYPGTPYYRQIRDQVDDFDYSKYSVYEPVLKYKYLTAQQVKALHARCFAKYYFRSRYFRDNWHLLWPGLQRLGLPIPARKAA